MLLKLQIVEKFEAFEAPMVVSGEVNIWPHPHLAPFMPPSSQGARQSKIKPLFFFKMAQNLDSR